MANRQTFGMRTTALEATEGIDLSGKVAIVTGGGSGLGKETARVLALRGAQVYVGVRDPESVKKAFEELNEQNGNALKIVPLALDLGDLSSVRAFTDNFKALNVPLHILVNNAGIMALPERRETKDGFEANFGTNHLGHFVLSNRLLPLLIASATDQFHSRIVSVSSIAHRRSGILFDDVQLTKSYDKWVAYGQSKTANILFAVELANRLKARNITNVEVFSLHPGGIKTNLQREMKLEEMRAMGWVDEHGNLNERFKTIEQGSSTQTYAATAPELNGKSGAYLEDTNISQTHTEESRDENLAKKLWVLSEELVKENFP